MMAAQQTMVKPVLMKRSINGKLSKLVVLAVGVAMLFVAGFGCWQESYRYLAGKRDVLLATASAFAAASADAVALQDRRGASRAIRGIGSLPAIDFASLTDRNGKPLAGIGSGVRLAGDLDLTDGDARSNPLQLLRTRTVSVTVVVKKGGAAVGRLKLIGHVTDLWGRLRGVIWTTASGALVALAIGLGISLRLQRAIIHPLLALTRAMGTIQTSHDYEMRVEIDSDDEIGLLAMSFNSMIGEVRERDRRLVAHRDQLEHDVAERTHDLRLAKNDAEAANVAKSTFLATMSHEIRTPMTGLMVMAELLASADLPVRARRHAEVICKSGSALLAIINDILDFSKIEAGKLEIERVSVDIRDVVNTVVALFYPRAAEKNLDLAAWFDPDVPRAIEGDPTRLQQIVSNLVNNALKFTKEGHVLIEVSYEDGALVCAVIDTGVGIARDKLDRIFQAFSQADGSTTREFGGTGLGLSISGRLAEAMSGAIGVSSTPGLGSTFTCRVPARLLLGAPPRPVVGSRGNALLQSSRAATSRAVASAAAAAGFQLCAAPPASAAAPLDLLITDGWGAETTALAGQNTRVIRLCEPGDAAEAADLTSFVLRLPFVEADLTSLLDSMARGDMAPSPAPAPARAGAQSFKGARVLVADDTAVNREVMIEALSRFAIVPDLAVNGLEALAAASSQPYDLVLMDASMPELDGFEACRRLRAQEAGERRTPVLALTAHVIGTAADAWREAGMDGVLHKPFTLAELQRVLAIHLRSDPQAAADGEVQVVSSVEPSLPARLEDGDGLEPLLDEAVLAEISAMSRDTQHGFAWRVFRLFIEHAPQGMEAVAAAREAGDHGALAAAAHAIKSMSVNIGARQAGSAAAAVERSARTGVIQPLEIEALALAVARTCEAFKERLLLLAPQDVALRA